MTRPVPFLHLAGKSWFIGITAAALIVGAVIVLSVPDNPVTTPETTTDTTLWNAPDWATVPAGSEGELIRYGRELIERTSRYLGPNGEAGQFTNGMNCQNCHLNGGTKPFGNNFSAVAATYPKYRDRSGAVESIPKRVNDCIERSLNGKPISVSSREMHAIVAYIKWLGRDVPEDTRPLGVGLLKVTHLNRAADPSKGREIFNSKCTNCHNKDGTGVANTDGRGWLYPPLWGPQSFNDAAGLYRIGNMAGYIKANMPFGVNFRSPQLSDEEAWDIAAFINSQPRPHKDTPADWPDISKKPIDYPFGPFVDGFSETAHKYGPFDPIIARRNSTK